jgi:superfamily II DNA or RNA helicase
VARGSRIAILAHRDEIIQQISAALGAFGVEHVLVTAGYDGSSAPVMVASVMTLARRPKLLAEVDLIVIDEAHHSTANSWRAIFDAAPKAKLLGVTATPERLDGQGLGDIYEVLIIGPAVSTLIEHGFLAPFATYAPNREPDLRGVRTVAGDYASGQLSDAMSKGVVISGAVEEYERLCPHKPALAFCVDRNHSRLVTAAFRTRGYRAEHVDSDTESGERRRLIAALGTGEVEVLCNCSIVDEGLDVPGVVAVLLLRPTKSLSKYLQQIGRALRPAPGKAKALILDHAGLTHRFGFADAERKWSLEGREKADGGEAPVKRCEACGALNPLSARACGECGAAFPGMERTYDDVPSRLAPLERLRIRSRGGVADYQELVRWAGTDVERLRLIRKANGFKAGWVHHTLEEARLTAMRRRLAGGDAA